MDGKIQLLDDKIRLAKGGQLLVQDEIEAMDQDILISSSWKTNRRSSGRNWDLLEVFALDFVESSRVCRYLHWWQPYQGIYVCWELHSTSFQIGRRGLGSRVSHFGVIFPNQSASGRDLCASH